MHYRLYTPSDFAALYAIEEACFQPPFRFSRSYMRHIVRDPETATWIAESTAESTAESIAEQNSQMIGFAIVEWGEGRKGTIAYIQTIEVLPAHRGKGIGAELLRRMESSARAAGSHTIWLHVDAENTSAINLYLSHGFESQGREENYYPQGRPALILAKSLENPAESR